MDSFTQGTSESEENLIDEGLDIETMDRLRLGSIENPEGSEIWHPIYSADFAHEEGNTDVLKDMRQKISAELERIDCSDATVEIGVMCLQELMNNAVNAGRDIRFGSVYIDFWPEHDRLLMAVDSFPDLPKEEEGFLPTPLEAANQQAKHIRDILENPPDLSNDEDERGRGLGMIAKVCGGEATAMVLDNGRTLRVAFSIPRCMEAPLMLFDDLEDL